VVRKKFSYCWLFRIGGPHPISEARLGEGASRTIITLSSPICSKRQDSRCRIHCTPPSPPPSQCFCDMESSGGQSRLRAEGGADASDYDNTTHTPRSHGDVSNPYQCGRLPTPLFSSRAPGATYQNAYSGQTICLHILKRHAYNHVPDEPSDGSEKRRRVTSLSTQSRVSHARRACANARVRCEELKPCTRCKIRDIPCEYSSLEAAATATM
jgi:hypothetical protein